MRPLIVPGIVAAILAAPAPASASVSGDFSGCDGLKKPKSKDDGMRGEATMSTFRFNRDAPDSIIASCNRALERKQLREHQNLRRAHLLRARAAAFLAKGEISDAFADLDAAEAELVDYRGEFFFDRSMGLSLDLLRAIALSESGAAEEALRIAQRVAQERPYALQFQLVSTLLIDANQAEEMDREPIWSEIVKIAPDTRRTAKARVMSQKDPEEQFAFQIERMGEDPLELSRSPMVSPFQTGNMNDLLNAWINTYADAVNLAYSHAALGQTDQARQRLSEIQAAIDAAQEPSEDGLRNTFIPIIKGLDQEVLQPRFAMVQARIALSEGRTDEVAGILEGAELASTLYSKELYASYDAARANLAADIKAADEAGSTADDLAADPPVLPQLADLPPLGDAISRRQYDVTRLARGLLVRPEDQRKLIDYKKSRPDVLGGLLAGALSMGISLIGGFDRTKGFQSEELADGSVKVEYNGDTTLRPVVQEMTLLRAAELTREAGKSHFVINNRKDFGVYWGNSMERTLTGFKTVLEISYLDETTSDPTALDAVAVIDALGPIYYGESDS